MPSALQFRRYANTTLSTLVGLDGEMIIDANSRAITIHDGITPGGARIATESYVNSHTGSNYTNANVAAYLPTYTGTIGANQISDINGSGLNFDSSYYVQFQYDPSHIYNPTNVSNGSFLFIQSGGVFFQSNVTGTLHTTSWNDDGTLSLSNTIIFADGTQQNTAFIGYATDNTARTIAQAAYDQSNTESSFVFANAAFNKANTASSNTITLFGIENTQNASITSAFNAANSSNTLAQSAFNAANTAATIIPQNAQSNNYVLQLSDAGKHIYYTQSSNVTLYIPTSSNVAFANGTTITIISKTSSSANVTVSPNTGVTMYLAGNTTSASRNVTTYGMATLIQVAANTWFINGSGVV